MTFDDQFQFKGEDGASVDRLNLAAPLFDSFFILGPNQIQETEKPNCLYDFPHTHIKSASRYSCNIDQQQYSTFFFPDGINYHHTDEEFELNNSTILNVFFTPPTIHDKIIFIKNKGGIAHYIYCLRYKCNIFNRPTGLTRSILDSVFQQNISSHLKETNFKFTEEEKRVYMSKIAEMFTLQIQQCFKTKKCPICLYAFCFETKNPFHDFYFELIETLIKIEFNQRSKSPNIQTIIQNIISHQISKKLDNQYTIIDDEYVEKANIDLNDNHLFEFNWPYSSYNARENFMNMLYNDLLLPAINEEIHIKFGYLPEMKVIWKRPTVEQYCLSICTFGISPLLSWITLNDFLQLFTCVCLEYSILVIGTSIENVTRVVSSLEHITFPFSWAYPIITIIPQSLSDVLGSPIPFLYGMYKNLENLNTIATYFVPNNTLIIDLDNQSIQWPVDEFPLLSGFKQYTNALKKFCTLKSPPIHIINDYSIVLNKDKASLEVVSPKTKVASFFDSLKSRPKDLQWFFQINKIDQIINQLFQLNFQWFVSKIHQSIITRVQYFGNDEKIESMLHDECYFRQFEDPKDIPFVQKFIKSQIFISIKEQICRIRTATNGPYNSNYPLATFNIIADGKSSTFSFDE